MRRADPSSLLVLANALSRRLADHEAVDARQVRYLTDRCITTGDRARQLWSRYPLAGAWASESFTVDLRAALRRTWPELSPERTRQISSVAARRASRVARLMHLKPGLERRALGKELREVHVGRHPFRPISVAVTPYPQKHAAIPGFGLIRYIDVGPADAPPDRTLLLIHGHASRLEEYDDLVSLLLPRGFRIIVPDLPGYGYSAKPDVVYSVAYFTRFLHAFLDGIGVDKVVPAGGSLGGNLVIRLGHTDRLRPPRERRFPRLISWSTASSWGDKPILRKLTRFGRWIGLYWSVLQVQSGSWYSTDWAGRFAALEDGFRFRREVDSPEFRNAFWDLAEDQWTGSLMHIATEIKAEALLMVGSEDNNKPLFSLAETVKNLARMLPKGSFKEVRGAKHSLANERAEEVAENIAAFLES